MSQTIHCPHCSQEVEITQALTHQLTEQIKRQQLEEFQKQLQDKDRELEEKLKAAQKSQQDFETKLRQQLNEQFKQEKERAMQKAKQDLELDLKNTQEEAQEAKESQQKLQEQVLELTRELRKARERDQQRELEMEKKLAEEQDKIRQSALMHYEEQHRLKLAEKDKKLSDAIKANEELRRKLEQGSQQTQGEVLELELEDLLRDTFLHDQIKEVPKGIRGADVMQVVYDTRGNQCGTILWESKNTKNWSSSWISKLKEDQRTLKAELAVLVSTVLPEHIKNFSSHDGVWISDRLCVLGLATALRSQLIKISGIKRSNEGKGEKMEVLYNYLSGIEFKQRIEAMVESFTLLQKEMESEKRFFTTKWARQEKQLRQVLDQTHGMYGDLQGIIGNSLPTISQLELPE